MNKPFTVLPSVGYRNDHFQVVSGFNELIVDIIYGGNVLKSIKCSSDYPVILTTLSEPGIYNARCNFNGIYFEQEFEVLSALRLGSSKLKKAFIFDDSPYSFFLMKDRLLLYDEIRRVLLTENQFSPSSIHQLDYSNYLFVTTIGDKEEGITNLGVYNTTSLSMIDELIDKFKVIKIFPELNLVWVLNFEIKTIFCYQIEFAGKCFIELKKFSGFEEYFLDDSGENIFILSHESVEIASLIKLNESSTILKMPSNAVDKLGNIVYLGVDHFEVSNVISGQKVTINNLFDFNLDDERYIHVGDNLRQRVEKSDYLTETDLIKRERVPYFKEDTLNHNYYFEAEQIKVENFRTHVVYITIGGLYLIQKDIETKFDGVKFTKYDDEWQASPRIHTSTKLSFYFINRESKNLMTDRLGSLSSWMYVNNSIKINDDKNIQLWHGKVVKLFDRTSTINFYKVNSINYVLVSNTNKHSLYLSSDLSTPVLNEIEIINREFINSHEVIWYKGSEVKSFNNFNIEAYDLRKAEQIFIDERSLKHSLFRDATTFAFYKKYGLSSTGIIFNPINFEIKDAIVGEIEYHSNRLNKFVSKRSNLLYLSIFDPKMGKYIMNEIKLEKTSYLESYLSPNGRNLILLDESNKYAFFDLEKNETTYFFSGSFLGFKDDGNLLIEDNNTRLTKIIDPETFQDITPPNYHHYRFLSPDGKLYAQVSEKYVYFNRITNIKITKDEAIKYRNELTNPLSILERFAKDRYDTNLKAVNENRKKYFELYRDFFDSIDLKDYTQIVSEHIVKIEKSIELGIVGTSIMTEVKLPDDLEYYNYAAFSFDNKYFGYVGKPISKGLIHLFKIDFDEKESRLILKDDYESRIPSKASWVCGFSRTGYFATYDSNPNTYIIEISDNLFSRNFSDEEINSNIHTNRHNLYFAYKNWNIIKKKNFLCFSPSGQYFALSEQGYDPLTLGGYGHRESNVVHIAKTDNGLIVESFKGHGDIIKANHSKKVTFVAFSEDESKIMSLSSDGVVIVRDINLR